MAKAKWPEVEKKLKQGLVEAWARNGLNELQIAKNLGISHATMELYKKERPDFLTALKRGKEVVDLEVENALYKRAMGYEYDEKTYEMGQLTKVVTKQVAPDVTAQIFWLKNRKPQEWRDKRDFTLDSDNLTINVTVGKPNGSTND